MDELIEKHMLHRKLEGDDFIYTLNYRFEDGPDHILSVEYKYSAPLDQKVDLKKYFEERHDSALKRFKEKIYQLLHEHDSFLEEEGGMLVLKRM